MIHANDNNPSGLTYLSVCSGIEAASVAWHPLGWRAVAYSEIEKFPSAVLAHHYPDVPNLGDFTKIDVASLGQVDILAGGTPCQAFSVAGLRQSLADERGNLSLEFVRLAHELAANNGLRNVVWENVVGVLSTKDNAFGCFLAGLVGADSALVPCERPKDGKSNRYWKWSRKERLHVVSWPTHGMVAGPKGRAAWSVKDGQFFRVAQRRRRVLLVADFGAGADPATVLFEPESLPRDTPPSREKGKDVAGAVAGGAEEGGECVAKPLLSGGHANNPIDENLVAVGVHGDVARTLKAEGADASEDGTGRGTPVICIHADSIGRTGDAVTPSADAAGVVRLRNPGMGIADDGTSYNLMASGQPHAVAFAENSRAELRLEGGDGQTVGTIGTGGGKPGQGYPAVLTSAVRRLTPRECERLQGFPDDYTAIPWRGKPADQCPDGPRYKALGNSWAVPKFAWLGRRIQALMPQATNDNNQETPIADAA
ncbi:DNA cytosine methyltransferase [Sinorhizobium meliloti]|uniref:DNA cytosine methyltransferase n=1 Tax=Rhizobium meliloti TaxID=382 RepID=UPI0003FD8F64|nr:DNA cytosine methyltransferase [Sinorhizobium meliloti]